VKGVASSAQEGRGSSPEAHFIEIDKRQHVNSILQAIFKPRQGFITVQTTPPLANLMQGNEAVRVKDSKCKFDVLNERSLSAITSWESD
jgi:hypothetical protein